MSAEMIAMRGRLQKEGDVIHVICDRIVNHDEMWRAIAQTDFTAFLDHSPRDDLITIRGHDFD